MLLEQLDAIKQRFFDVELAISSPDAVSDRKRFAQLNREYKDLKALVDKADEYRTVVSNLEHARQVIQNEKDEEFREMARLELDDLSARSTVLEEEIRQLLLPADPEDAKDAILEIRAGTGGDEASLFAGDLYRMYTRYCERRGLRVETVDFTEGTSRLCRRRRKL